MNISLTPILENFVKHKVNTGLYNSASEVVREALRSMEEGDALKQVKLESLRSDLAEGLASLKVGEGRPFNVENIIARGEARLAKRNHFNG